MMNALTQKNRQSEGRTTANTDTAAQERSQKFLSLHNNNPEITKQLKIAESLNQRPAVQSQILLQRTFNQSPPIVAQTKLSESLSSRNSHQSVIQQQSGLEDEEDQPQQMKAESAVTKSNNTGLPDHLKAGIENLSGISMDDVRVDY